VVFDALDSTNESILEAGETDAPEGTTHIARRQTRGRGRAGHTWWSPAGAGLWMSTLLRPRVDRRLWGGISLVAGAAAHDALLELGVTGIRLYWPNDLVVDRRKIGGILGEVRVRGERAWVALGFGINLDLTAPETRAEMPEALRGSATSVVEVVDPSRAITTDTIEIGRLILDHFWRLYEGFLDGEPVPLLVRDRLAHFGGTVEVRQTGIPPRRGTVKGLGSAGELLIQAGPEVLEVVAGEVLYEYDP
jgi:BirA family biotin operon repressor/biotin-[acetyl-CoA-carboxylase] ligase